jgi:uncharacterized membrane protein
MYNYCPHCGEPLLKDEPKSGEPLLKDEPRLYQPSIGDWLARGWQLFLQDAAIYVVYTILLVVVTALPIIPVVFSGVLAAGFYNVAIRRAKNLPVRFSDVFIGWQEQFTGLVLAGLLTNILISIGIVLLFIPGVYLATSYIFTIPLILQRGIGFRSAMGMSRREVGRSFFRFLGLQLLLVLFIFLGTIPAGLGLLVAVPLMFTSNLAAYEDTFGLI